MQLSINTPKLHSYYNKSAILKSQNRNCAGNAAQPEMPAHKSSPFNPEVFAVSFSGERIYMLDGGQHADDLYYFAKAIDSDFDLQIMPLELNPKDKRIKQLKSLKESLEKINSLPEEKRPDYIAIPMGVHVALQNLSNQMSKIFEKDIRLTPEKTDMQHDGKLILKMLKILSDYPDDNRHYIRALDPLGQGIEYTYPIIQEINKAAANGIKVYIPSGHPTENSIKWLARDRKLKPEFYYYISHGQDINGTVAGMKKFVKDRNWYDFNLLALSKADKVALKDKNNNDHLFSSYDACITRGARGVYNFTPVRENGELKGFSFTDETTVQYPVDKYKMIKNIENLLVYVGRNINEVEASPEEVKNFKSFLNGDTRFKPDDFKAKLFPVEEVFSPDEIKNQRIYLQGEYTDAERKLFFTTRDDGTVLFNKCNYEQTAKPSVVSMWGCCFSLFNAIKEDIEKSKQE